MIKLKKIILIGASVLFVAGFSACEKPGPAETAGKAIDETAEKAADKIDHAGDSLSSQGDKAGEVINDAAITTKVKTAIFAEPGLSSLQINVDTMHGVVTLSGAVDSQQSIDKAKEIASAVSDVKAVENTLTVK